MQKWHFDQLTSELLIVRSMNFGYRNTFQLIDKGIIEIFGPLGFSMRLLATTKVLSKQQSGFLYHYSFVMMMSILMILGFFLYFLSGLTNFENVAFVCLLVSYILFFLNL
jgi:hypothetical protein